MSERALAFDCAGEWLVGVLAEPDAACDTAVVIVVGGPQYRAGSHRQFVSLARALAAAGVAALRFDYRGMGDSTGAPRLFVDTAADIDAAISAVRATCPAIERFVLCGLCDGASAALVYWHRSRDARVAGIALMNPWVRSQRTIARTHLRHYYVQRLRDRRFWQRLLTGKLGVARAAGSVASAVRDAGARDQSTSAETGFQRQMAHAIAAFRGPVLVVLSGQDLTALEFVDYARSESTMGNALARANVEQRRIAAADHTFSSAAARDEVQRVLVEWIRESVTCSGR